MAAWVYDAPDLYWLMLWYAVSYPLFALNGTSVAVLTTWGQFRSLAAVELATKALTLVVVSALLLLGAGVAGLVLGMAAGQTANGLGMALAAALTLRRDGVGPWWRAPRADAPLRKEMTGLFGWNYLLVTMTGLTGQVPVMMLGYFRGPVEAGFYRLAVTLMTTASYLELALSRVTYPVLCTLWREADRQRLYRRLVRWTLRGGLAAAACVVVATALLPWIVALLFGAGFQEVVPGAQLLFGAVALSTVFFWVNSLNYASGRLAMLTKAHAVHAAVVLLLGWVVVDRWGFLGMAAVVAAGKVLFTLYLVNRVVASAGQGG